jgi:hypothetical protein
MTLRVGLKYQQSIGAHDVEYLLNESAVAQNICYPFESAVSWCFHGSKKKKLTWQWQYLLNQCVLQWEKKIFGSYHNTRALN